MIQMMTTQCRYRQIVHNLITLKAELFSIAFAINQRFISKTFREIIKQNKKLYHLIIHTESLKL